jgi:hypothetical protein
MQVLKTAKAGFAMALASMFAQNHANAPRFRDATKAKRARRVMADVYDGRYSAGAKIRRAFNGGLGDGKATARHGIPYNDRATRMRLRAMANGAQIRIERDTAGKIIGRAVVWPKAAV